VGEGQRPQAVRRIEVGVKSPAEPPANPRRDRVAGLSYGRHHVGQLPGDLEAAERSGVENDAVPRAGRGRQLAAIGAARLGDGAEVGERAALRVLEGSAEGVDGEVPHGAGGDREVEALGKPGDL
jgi:hypothetical protein